MFYPASASRGAANLLDAPPPEGAVNVLLVYPRGLTGRLIAEALSHNRNILVAAHVSTIDAAIAFTSHTQIHVALIGMNLDRTGDGLEMLRRLRAENQDIRSIMLMENPDEDSVVEAFCFGAKGIFPMASSGYESLCKCIQRVHDGQIWVNSQELHWVMNSLRDMSLANPLISIGRHTKASDMQKLSKREREVIALLADGLSNRDIAFNLNLSENTIKNYLFRMFEKFGVSNRTELLLHTFGVPMRTSLLDIQQKTKLTIATR